MICWILQLPTVRLLKRLQVILILFTYYAALDKTTGDRDMNLRKFELEEEDWKTATDLRDVLKVSQPILL
jgi:hypothetical protein